MSYFRRNIFTGELEEVPSEGGGRKVIARTTVSPHLVQNKTGSAWGRPLVDTSLAVPIEEIDAQNEAAKRHGTGAYYVPGDHGFANVVFDSRQARAREYARRECFDGNGGYGDAQPGDSARYKSAKYDLVERLRSRRFGMYGRPSPSPYGNFPGYTEADVDEAADEIERLQFRLAGADAEIDAATIYDQEGTVVTQGSFNALEALANSYRSELERLRERDKSLVRDKGLLENMIHELRIMIKDLRAELADADDEIADLRTDLATARNERDQLDPHVGHEAP